MKFLIIKRRGVLLSKAKIKAGLLIAGMVLLSVVSCVDSNNPVDEVRPKLIWSAPIPSAFSNLVMPLIEQGKAYVASDTSLFCFDLKTGTPLWKRGLGISRSIAGTRILSSGTAIFLNHGSIVWAFEKLTGNPMWSTAISGFSPKDLEAMTQNSTHLFLGANGEVVRISKATGNVDLRIALVQLVPNGVIQGAFDPIVSDGDNHVYVPTGYFPGDTLRGNLLCYDSNTGQYQWGYPIPSSAGYSVFAVYSCVLKDSMVIFPVSASMIALNRFEGRKVWSRFVSGDAFSHSPVVLGETVYMGSTAQARMYAFDVLSGTQKWASQSTGSSITTFISPSDGRVYFCDYYQIWVLDAGTGNVIWHGYPPEHNQDPQAIYTSPVAVGEGYMVVVGNKKIYCLSVP